MTPLAVIVGELGVALGVGVAVALLIGALGQWWLGARRRRGGRRPGHGASGLPWWCRLALPGRWLMACLPFLALPPASRRHYALLLRRADCAARLSPEEVRAAQWGLVVTAALGAIPLLAGAASFGVGLGMAMFLALLWRLPGQWLRRQAHQRRATAVRALPFALDMMTLCLEGGLHFQGAVQHVVEKGPRGPLRDELLQWLGDMRAGASRADALRALAQRLDHPAVRSWVQVMLQAEGLGMSLGPILRAQAEQRRAERFLRAEKLALQAPVKMLFPLILCIFPCTFLVIGFPIVMHLLAVAA